MEHKKELLVDQLKAVFDEPAWQPNLNDALENLTFQAALSKSSKDSHSIWEIVDHLIYWNELWLGRYREDDVSHIQRMKNDQTFLQSQTDKTEDTWLGTKNKVLGIFESWYTAVSKSSEEKINSSFKFSDESQEPWWIIVSNAILHNSYHIGQIIAIRKMQENWNNKY